MKQTISRVKAAGGRKSWSILILLALTVAFHLVACEGEDPEKDVAEELTFDSATWEQALLEKRTEKDKHFKTSETSYLAGVQQITLSHAAGEKAWLTRSGILLKAPEDEVAAVVLAPSAEGWEWTRSDPEIHADLRGEPVEPGILKVPMLFHLGRFTVQIWGTSEELNAGVFDAERADYQNFESLLYFPPDENYVLPARLERLEKPEPFEMAQVQFGSRKVFRCATVHFELDGEPRTLSAFKIRPESKILFIPFRDTTARKETYGAGRTLNIEEPEGDRFFLDFNEAANFPCCYSPAFNCPLPPKENIMDVAIHAGEKTYPITK